MLTLNGCLISTDMQITVLLCVLTCSVLSVFSTAEGKPLYGALGKPLQVKFKPNTKQQDVKLYKSSAIIYELKNFSATFYDPSVEWRWRFDLINGRIDIPSTERDDAGAYRMESAKETETFQVIIEAEVTHAIVSPVCHAGERRVSCSAASGDNIQFSWLVDGIPPTADLSADNQTLSLQGEAMASLSCTAKNSVSSAKVSTLLVPCLDMETFCDATKDASCYGTAGKPVYLQMNIFSISSITYEIKLTNKGHTYNVWTYRRSKLTSARENWHFRVDSKTLSINASQKSDSGAYSIDMYGGQSGRRLGHQKVNLTIEAAISAVSITFTCLSQWEKRVVCLTNGDALWYNWSLDGRPLNATELVANTSEGDQGHVIILRRNTEENITCTATNHVSSGRSTQLLTPCIDVSFWFVWTVEIIILMFLNIAGYCCRRTFSQEPAKRQVVEDMVVEEHQETEDHHTEDM